MMRLSRVIGNAADAALAERLHALEHEGAVEYVELSRGDTQRRRLRLATDRGTDCAIALDRNTRLGEGDVLLLEPGRAIVVRLHETPWLILEPKDAAAALALGYLAGNLHWRIKFDGPRLAVAMDGDPDFYAARLRPFFDAGTVRRCDDGKR